MSIQTLKNEIKALKKEIAPDYKTTEEILKINGKEIQELTDEELFRAIQYYNPELKTMADLTNDVLKQMIEETIDEPAAD